MSPLLDLAFQVTAVVKPISVVDVENLNIAGLGVDAFNRVRVVTDDVGVSEEGQAAGEEIVEVRGHGEGGWFVLAEQMGQAKIGVGDGFALD